MINNYSKYDFTLIDKLQTTERDEVDHVLGGSCHATIMKSLLLCSDFIK